MIVQPSISRVISSTKRTVWGRAAGNTLRTQKQTQWNETRSCTNAVVALQDHCSHKCP